MTHQPSPHCGEHGSAVGRATLRLDGKSQRALPDRKKKKKIKKGSDQKRVRPKKGQTKKGSDQKREKGSDQAVDSQSAGCVACAAWPENFGSNTRERFIMS